MFKRTAAKRIFILLLLLYWISIKKTKKCVDLHSRMRKAHHLWYCCYCCCVAAAWAELGRGDGIMDHQLHVKCKDKPYYLIVLLKMNLISACV